MNTDSQPLVTVVTPMYNNVQYVKECIESVRSQTYRNWHYVIVNNCSTDGSADIAHGYAKQDPRITVHDNQQFLPVAANHNAAMRQLSPASKYCKMVFSDDWIFPRCLEEMVAMAEAHPSAGIVGAFRINVPTWCWCTGRVWKGAAGRDPLHWWVAPVPEGSG